MVKSEKNTSSKDKNFKNCSRRRSAVGFIGEQAVLQCMAMLKYDYSQFFMVIVHHISSAHIENNLFLKLSANVLNGQVKMGCCLELLVCAYFYKLLSFKSL